MDVSLLIRHRLEELGLGQRDLARAARVTESYVSQLLTRKKPPPAPNRTDIYDRMETLLKLPQGELSTLVDLQRKEELKRELGEEPVTLFKEVRELILRKCTRENEAQIRAIFEKQPFGELERLVAKTLLDAVQGAAKDKLDNDAWLRNVAELSGRTYEETRVTVLDFLDTDVYHLSMDNCVSFLEPLIESWDIDLATFALKIVLNDRLAPDHVKKFAFIETASEQADGEEPGFKAFLQDSSLSGTATNDEIAFLRELTFNGRRPTPLYYYRALQNLRDPLHFAPHRPKREG